MARTVAPPVSMRCAHCGQPFEVEARLVKQRIARSRGMVCCSKKCARNLGRLSPEDRFWSKVDRTGGPESCWPWMAFCDEDGYGNFWLDGKTVRSHRAAFYFTHGSWPEHLGCHECDNPPCCNPRHIYDADNAKNIADRDARGRHWVRRGESHADAKLTEEAVLDIRTNYWPGEVPMRVFAERYGVSIGTISDAIEGRTWSHVADPLWDNE